MRGGHSVPPGAADMPQGWCRPWQYRPGLTPRAAGALLPPSDQGGRDATTGPTRAAHRRLGRARPRAGAQPCRRRLHLAADRHRTLPRPGAGRGGVHPRRSERRGGDPAPRRGVRHHPAFRRRFGGTAVRGGARRQYPRAVPRLRGGPARGRAGAVRLVQSRHRLSRTQPPAGRGLPVAAGRVLRPVESLWRVDGADVPGTSTAWRAWRCASAPASPSR